LPIISNYKEKYEMKHLKIAGLCLVSMFVMSMALAGTASALPALLWLLCLENATGTLTKYSSNQCTKAEAAGKWQSLGLPSGGSDTVRLLAFSLRLADTGLGGATVECPDFGTGWGLINETNKLVTKVAESNNPAGEGCKLLKTSVGCPEINKVTKINGVNLPWTSELTETEGKYLSTITKTGNGKPPGWAVTCNNITDTCEEEAGKPELAFVGQGVTKEVLLVLLSFETRTKAKCSIGGAKAGEVGGLIAILLWEGNGLSFTTI
jgi:hypothetical protein